MVGVKKKFIWIRYLLATFLLLCMVFPYLYMVLHSFADWSQVDREWIPTQFTWKSYEWLLTGGEFATPQPWIRAFVNSLIVTGASTLLILVFGMMAAYALAKIPFKGRGFLNHAVLFHMFFPAIILLIPQFLIIQKAGLYDTYWAMILPKALSLWAIFMLANFFKAIPDPFIEAAKLDGANHLQILSDVQVHYCRGLPVCLYGKMDRTVMGYDCGSRPQPVYLKRAPFTNVRSLRRISGAVVCFRSIVNGSDYSSVPIVFR
ncbi:multiple sugar transport system permease protein [Lihuaxuella thermophila]|uniref:Multiple sugar transport system permease protein n=1 Tax=Lihuaxuella thermophila TaxID=1173111 RepID=A0A1H8CJE2_9BACL|nr:multiple sugar transport system permease protein [Lihuaxuella thermophila]